jgi:hypothetical protein
MSGLFRVLRINLWCLFANLSRIDDELERICVLILFHQLQIRGPPGAFQTIAIGELHLCGVEEIRRHRVLTVSRKAFRRFDDLCLRETQVIKKEFCAIYPTRMSQTVKQHPLRRKLIHLFDFVRKKRSTDQYAKGHIEYLSSGVTHIANELREALPPVAAEAQYTEGLTQVDALGAELRNLRSRIGHADELAREQGHIASITKELQQAISSL